MLLLSSDQPRRARASFSSREIISSFPSCPGYLSCHTRGWCISDPGEKVQTWICLGETPLPWLSFKVPKLGKAVPSHQQEQREGLGRRGVSGETKPQSRFAGLYSTARKPRLFFSKGISLSTLVIKACEKAFSPSWGCCLSYSWPCQQPSLHFSPEPVLKGRGCLRLLPAAPDLQRVSQLHCLKMGGIYDKFWLITSRILTNIWEPICCQCTSKNKGTTGTHQRQNRQQEMCVRGETITMGNFSPHPDSSWTCFLTTSEHFSLVLPCAAPAPLSSCPKPFLSPLPHFLLSFTLWFWVKVSLLAQTAERKDGPKVRGTTWAGESHIQFSPPLTSHLTLGILFHTSSCPPLPSAKYCSEISVKGSKHFELDGSHQPLQKTQSVSAGCLSLGETAILPSSTGRLCSWADSGRFRPPFPRVTASTAVWPSSQGTDRGMNTQRCCSSPTTSPKPTWRPGRARRVGHGPPTLPSTETHRLLLGCEKEEEKCNKRQE